MLSRNEEHVTRAHDGLEVLSVSKMGMLFNVWMLYVDSADVALGMPALQNRLLPDNIQQMALPTVIEPDILEASYLAEQIVIGVKMQRGDGVCRADPSIHELRLRTKSWRRKVIKQGLLPCVACLS